MKMLRNFIPVSRHFNVLQSPERLSSQFLRLTRCDLQNQIICRLVHKKVNSKPNSKVADDGLFDHLRSIKVTKSSKYEKRPPRQYENQKTYRRKFENEFDLFNVIRPKLEAGEDSLEDRIFEKEHYTPEQIQKYKDSMKLLSTTMTPELEEQILEGRPHQKLLLRETIVDIEHMETRKGIKYYIPPSLSIDEWRTVISLHDYRTRMPYLHSLVVGAPSLEEILKQDEIYANPLQLDPEITEKIEDGEAQKRIKIFLMEHEMMRQDGEIVPYQYNEQNVINMSELESSPARTKLMTYMLKKELTNLFEEMKKRQKAFDLPKQYEEYKEKSDEAEIFYGLWHNTIFLRHNKQRINSALDWKVAREHHEWGIPLVIDFSHTGKYRLDRQRYRSLLCEIRNSAMTNREAKTPFQLHITDVQEDLTPKFMSDLLDKKEVAPFNLTSESHLDMFPRDRLVYLSPDSRNDLVNFNPDDIYVIGGIIDTCKSSPLTLTTAKKLKIRHARFPMRQVVGLQAPLNIDTCLAIMNDLKESNDWFYALRWVPSRYLANRLKGFSDRTAGSAESLLMYRAHRMLSPSKADKEQSLRNHNLNATQYRYYYKKIMECKSKEEMEILLKELEI